MIPDDKPWEIFDEPRRFAGALYGPQRTRMVVVGLGAGELLVVSPGVPLGEARAEQLARWGTPRFLLAPNHFHNAGLAWWKGRFPGATVVAHPRAHARLRRKVPGVVIDDLAALEAALPEGVRVFGPPMAKQGETWLSIRTEAGVAWSVPDAFVNLTRLPRGGLGLVMWMLGFRAGLMANPSFERFFLRDRAGYRAWVAAELDRDRPALLVPAHGAPAQGSDVCNRLKAITEAA